MIIGSSFSIFFLDLMLMIYLIWSSLACFEMFFIKNKGWDLTARFCKMNYLFTTKITLFAPSKWARYCLCVKKVHCATLLRARTIDCPFHNCKNYVSNTSEDPVKNSFKYSFIKSLYFDIHPSNHGICLLILQI